MMNENALQNKIETLKAFRELKSDYLEQLGPVLKGMDDWDLLRINPLSFAQQQGWDEAATLDLFIHGAKVGLFDFSYNMVCPYCGGIANNHQDLDELEAEMFHCQMCNVDVPTYLDGQVDVSFAIHPEIKALPIDPLRDANSYVRYYFSPNYQKQRPFLDYAEETFRAFQVLAPDESFSISVDGEPGYFYRVASIEHNASCWIIFDSEGPTADHQIEINILAQGMRPAELHVAPGHYELTVHNRSRVRLGTIYHYFNLDEFMATEAAHPMTIVPYLTASGLINTQSFRDLFRTQQLPETLSLNIKNLTIMFTDLRGSTAMYDRVGDILAYQFIKKHFELLAQSIRLHSGAIVKTMGDAVMAAFVSPARGFSCALDMLQKMQQLNEEWRGQGYEAGLKVGLYNGPVLTVVNDERLDYFGQSVNIASRIQGLAGASEVYVSDALLKEIELEPLLAEYGYQLEGRQAALRGVEQPVPVYRVYRG